MNNLQPASRGFLPLALFHRPQRLARERAGVTGADLADETARALSVTLLNQAEENFWIPLIRPEFGIARAKPGQRLGEKFKFTALARQDEEVDVFKTGGLRVKAAAAAPNRSRHRYGGRCDGPPVRENLVHRRRVRKGGVDRRGSI